MSAIRTREADAAAQALISAALALKPHAEWIRRHVEAAAETGWNSSEETERFRAADFFIFVMADQLAKVES